MPVQLIWVLVILGYGLSRFTEWRIHRRNYRILRAAGAEESVPFLMWTYYAAHVLMVPAALVEQWWLKTDITSETLLWGLGLLLAGQCLRYWAIQSLGHFWTMRCLGLPGLKHLRCGPYKYMDNPEYLSRLMDGVGFCLMFGAKVTLAAYLLMILALNRRLVTAERRQLDELMEHRPFARPDVPAMGQSPAS